MSFNTRNNEQQILIAARHHTHGRIQNCAEACVAQYPFCYIQIRDIVRLGYEIIDESSVHAYVILPFNIET